MNDRPELPRRTRSERPCFFDDPAIDQLYAVVLAAAAELSVAYERIDALERLLAAKGVLGPGEVDAFRPDEAAELARAERRREFIERVFAVLGPGGQALARAADMPAWPTAPEEPKGD